MSQDHPIEPGDTAPASNAETVVPGGAGAGAAGTSGGGGDADPEAMRRAAEQADAVEAHNEPAGDDQGMRATTVPDTAPGGGDDVPPPDVGQPDPSSPAGMPPTAPTPDDPGGGSSLG